jgi:PKD repeat protein
MHSPHALQKSGTRPAGTARQRRSLGQSLVEFALVLPILLLLTLMAIDFGRVYLGYINLQSMARIAANFAANNPDAWGATPDLTVQTKYKSQIIADAAATNCTLPPDPNDGNKLTKVPDPVFTDTNGDGNTDSLGDQAKVGISCSFGVITPIISSIVGGKVTVSAESDFPVKAGAVAFAGSGGGSGTAPVAAFLANGVVQATTGTPPPTISGVAPSFVVTFNDTSGGGPTSWSWTFGDGGTSTAQDPPVHTYTTPGPYVVTEIASNINGSSTATMNVIVTAASTVDFTASPTSGTAPLTVTFTDASTSGGTAHNWVFGDGSTSTVTSPTHTYTTAGTYTVSETVTYPSPTGNVTRTKTGLISVGAPLCTIPSLAGQMIQKEQSKNGLWASAGFNFNNLLVGPGTPNAKGANWAIASQTIAAGPPAVQAPCDTTMMSVNDH